MWSRTIRNRVRHRRRDTSHAPLPSRRRSIRHTERVYVPQSLASCSPHVSVMPSRHAALGMGETSVFERTPKSIAGSGVKFALLWTIGAAPKPLAVSVHKPYGNVEIGHFPLPPSNNSEDGCRNSHQREVSDNA